jgi:hypothetical protein
VYLSEGKTFNDFVLQLREKFPNMQLGLINNNTNIPRGDWPNCVLWQRSSLDAHNSETYLKIKGRDKYDICVENIYSLLASPISHVGVGFLYGDLNVEGVGDFLSEWYGRWKKMEPEARRKFNCQFRPVAPPLESAADESVDEKLELRLRKQIIKVGEMALRDQGFDEFISLQTNFNSVRFRERSYFLHTPKSFSKCYNALTHRVIRSDGNEHADFLTSPNPQWALGNVLKSSDPQEERMKIALGTFYYHHRLGRYCTPKSCRQGWVSNVMETYGGRDPAEFSVSGPASCFF